MRPSNPPGSAIRVVRDPASLFAKAEVRLMRRADGSAVLSSLQPLGPYPRSLSEYLLHWAHMAPDRPFLLERTHDGSWQGVTYGKAFAEVQRLAGWLLTRVTSPDSPVAILSDNSVEHGLLALAAMHVGIPAMPVSSAYSLASTDFARLKSIIELGAPSVIYVDDYARFAPALAAIDSLHNAALLLGRTSSVCPNDTARFDSVHVAGSKVAVARACTAVTPDSVAKLLFTSGSTGAPKGVINTQRMLCANQQQMAQVWRFTTETPPVIVDWLPWSHTFGGNHNFNFVLRAGGTLYIDGGRPVSGLFGATITNLREIAPTVYFNVPRGYDLLVPELRADEVLRRNFFERLQVIFYAAAALPQHLWEALEALALETTGERIVLVSAWGSTETAPLATSAHFRAEQAGVIGVPVPGCELKLSPHGPKLEVSVRGPQVTPGYWKRPDLTEQCFDEEGFYSIGDAVRMVDPDRPERGLYFDGRVSEDFKLSTGTWVNSGGLRVKALAAFAPIVQDLAVAGHDRSAIALLVFPALNACRQLCLDLPADAPVERVLAHAVIRERVRAGLRELHRHGAGSSTFATRALLMSAPPSIDSGEITDKGYINQRAVLACRGQLIERLYETVPPPDVITIDD